MPEFIFVLQRLFLRVDRVLVRIIDTRYFLRFRSNYVIRDHTVSAQVCNIGVVLLLIARVVPCEYLAKPNVAVLRR